MNETKPKPMTAYERLKKHMNKQRSMGRIPRRFFCTGYEFEALKWTLRQLREETDKQAAA